MKRRGFVAGLGAALAAPRTLLAQQRPARIGVLVTTSFFLQRFEAFRQAMRGLGYVEGKNLAYEYRNAEGKFERFPGLAAELTRAKVDLVFTASAEAVLALMQATSSIPIVFGAVQDPLASGIVDSLARPGRNATGMSAVAPGLGRKRLELLREIKPGLSSVAYLWSPASKGSEVGMQEAKEAAQVLGIKLLSLEARRLEDIDRLLASALAERSQGLLTSPDPIVNFHGAKIAQFAAANRLPAMYAAPEHIDVGGLISYAPNYGEMWRHAATFADRILKGAKPADLPVELPTKFDLIVNLKAARAIGLEIPGTFLFRADRVIE